MTRDITLYPEFQFRIIEQGHLRGIFIDFNEDREGNSKMDLPAHDHIPRLF